MTAQKKIVVAWPAFKNRDKNPYNSLLYRTLEQKGYLVREFTLSTLLKRMDVLHLHWPEDYANKKSFLSSAATLTVLLAACLIGKIRGTKIVWTAHNISAHEGLHRNLDWIYRKVYLNLVSDVAHLTKAGRNDFLACQRFEGLTKVRHHITPHGPYVMTPRPLAVRSVRKLLVLGQIRPYKRLTELVEIWSETEPQGWHLVIAGSGGNANYVNELQALMTASGSATLINRWLTDSEVENLAADADLVLVSAPRHNSGAIYLALSATRRVLAPDTPSNLELSQRVGPGWIILYDYPFSAESLAQSLSAIPEKNPSQDPEVDTWESIADAVAQIYERSESR
ncbi:hypothetical protein MTX35_11635 [Rhodococcus sp. ARC_M12]|uniref:hypothetical protein n=1 Tax=Rhodococcus sp. ARC_M12 TaxID=2928854 RepID=UPI001FB24D45|nr:hypothetical protein [Rhodococcus sp. ARC_M12]MCJ0978359.1 hypothetical protein [Rhodococcus sp. ARC_M12]